MAGGGKRRALAFYFSGARGKWSPPRATCITTEFIRNFSQNPFFCHLFELKWSPVPAKPKSQKSGLSRINPKSEKIVKKKQICGQFVRVRQKSSWAGSTRFLKQNELSRLNSNFWKRNWVEPAQLGILEKKNWVEPAQLEIFKKNGASRFALCSSYLNVQESQI